MSDRDDTSRKKKKLEKGKRGAHVCVDIFLFNAIKYLIPFLIRFLGNLCLLIHILCPVMKFVLGNE